MPGARVERAGPIACLFIDNPPLNLLSNAVRESILERLLALAADSAVRAVVVTGCGERAFSAGSDVREFFDETESGRGVERAAREREFLSTVTGFPKPTVAAVHGYALGGGCELAMACDFRIASADATFGFPEIKLGIFPINSVSASLRLFGEAKTKELMFLGDGIDADEAARIGFVSRVVPKDEVLVQAQRRAARLAALPGVTLGELKKQVALDEGGRPAEEALRRVFETADLREGVTALLEKRAPEFRHR